MPRTVKRFLLARLAERSTRVQLVALMMVGLVSAGLLTTDQITRYSNLFLLILTTLGPVMGMLFPDRVPEQGVSPAADAAVSAADKADAGDNPAIAEVRGAVAIVEKTVAGP